MLFFFYCQSLTFMAFANSQSPSESYWSRYKFTKVSSITVSLFVVISQSRFKYWTSLTPLFMYPSEPYNLFESPKRFTLQVVLHKKLRRYGNRLKLTDRVFNIKSFLWRVCRSIRTTLEYQNHGSNGTNITRRIVTTKCSY